MDDAAANLTRRISLHKEVDLELPLDPIIVDGQRVNPLTAKARCRAAIDVTMNGVYLTDQFDIVIKGDLRTGYDVVAVGPVRPGIAIVKVHSRTLEPLAPPPKHQVEDLPGLPRTPAR